MVSQLPNVATGAHGDTVRRVQGLLRAATPSSSDKTLAIDGSYGPATTAAVKAFQTSHQLTASGTVDQATWRKLLGV